MPVTALPRSAPSAVRVNAQGILDLVDALDADPRIDPHSIMVVKSGQVVAEGWWGPYASDRVHLLYSLSKTFTSTALGFAVAEGLVGMDDFVVDHFPEFADEVPERSRAIRVRDVAAMASGHIGEMILAALQTDPLEPVRGFLLNPPDGETGVTFAYNQPCTYTIATIIQRAANQTLVEYLRPRLLDPLGIGPVAWQEYPAGRNLGFSGLHARTEDIAKLGLAHLQDGRVGEAQILPEGWAAEVRTKRVETENEIEPDWGQGYGYQVWMSRHGYRGDGAFGQFCLILPELDLVVAMTNATIDMQAILDHVWEHLLPAADAEPASADVEAALVSRLASLSVPVIKGGAPDAGLVGDYTVTTEQAVTPVRSVRLAQDGDAWSITLVSDDGELTGRIGDGEWVITEGAGLPPLAVSGGGSRVGVILLDTPHRAVLEFDAAERTATLAWETEPLTLGLAGGLLDLRAAW